MHQEDIELKEENKKDSFNFLLMVALTLLLIVVLYSDIQVEYGYPIVMVLVSSLIYLSNCNKYRGLCSSCGKEHLSHFGSLGMTELEDGGGYRSVVRALCKECDKNFPNLRPQYLKEAQMKKDLEKPNYP